MASTATAQKEQREQERQTIARLGVPELQQLRAHAVIRIDDIDAALRGHGVEPPESPLSRPALARLLGVEESAIVQWEKDGVPAIRAKGASIAYHAPVVLAWWRTRETDRIAREAEQAWAHAVQVTRTAVLALPQALAIACVEAAPAGAVAVRRVLSEGIRGALRGLATWTAGESHTEEGGT
jgi:hypothetical protein